MDIIEINAKVLALECGALSLEAVVEWADEIILKSEEPDIRLFDVSVAKNKNDAVVALHAFGCSKDPKSVAKEAFNLFVHALENNLTSYENVSQKLYEMSFEPNALLPDDNAKGPMMTYWDELDIANDGIYGDPDKIKNEMLSFLKKHES
ncbi:hypothetical protein [Motilimonas pumila]|uniref:Uncharacterized protein n=1 Tax=Motilimonas pumila TaxID=2303987 RepID=A0A418YFX1_9GAMM|nr:hypothetical protein [Motilimonas pumila]RJG48209.1 hypothetical protein D1Z90_09080 [Motilimonas pumila]